MLFSDYPEQTLADLLEHRTEELSIEYKAWMDLKDHSVRAKLAKHICAICNHGGGWLIFGVENDGSQIGELPFDIEIYNQDTINGIAQKYLAPAPHCRVLQVGSRQNELLYPVVHIPSHGAVPVCAIANGPEIERKIVGITCGTHYIRVQGPQSVPINSPELWRDVIHRCVINERDSLLGSISRLFDRPSTATEIEVIEAWLGQALKHWSEAQLPEHMRQWRVDPVDNRTALAFRFLTASGSPPEPLSTSRLRRAIEDAQATAFGQFPYGLPPFVQLGNPQQHPQIILFDEVEGYQTKMVHDGFNYEREPTFWQITTDGRGIEIRCYFEDSDWVAEAVTQHSTRTWESGYYISPFIQARRVYHFVSFVSAFSKFFQNVSKIEMTSDYKGLKGRILNDPNALRSVSSRESYVDQRRQHIDVSPEALTGDGALKATAQLLSPMIRLFEGWSVTPDFVKDALKI